MKKPIALLAVPALYALLILSNLNLSSCTKSSPVTVRDTTYTNIYDTTIVKDTLTITKGPSIMSMLTGKQWEIDTVYWNYTGPGTGSLEYARGGATNVYDLDNWSSTYTVDGFFWADQNSTYISGQWNFTNNDSSIFEVNTPGYGADYVRIISLTDSTFTAYDSTGHAWDVEKVTPP
jgi:hypothetical protein